MVTGHAVDSWRGSAYALMVPSTHVVRYEGHRQTVAKLAARLPEEAGKSVTSAETSARLRQNRGRTPELGQNLSAWPLVGPGRALVIRKRCAQSVTTNGVE